MSARLALFALAAFAIGDSFIVCGSDAFAQSQVVQSGTPAVITTTPPAPASYNGSAYYNPGGNNSVTITDQTHTTGQGTITTRTINSNTPLPDPFTPNSYSIDGFTPTPPGYANAGQQSAITTHANGNAARTSGASPNAQFAPSAATAQTGYTAQSAATYNGAAEAGAAAAIPALNNANVNANAVNATQSHAGYHSD